MTFQKLYIPSSQTVIESQEDKYTSSIGEVYGGTDWNRFEKYSEIGAIMLTESNGVVGEVFDGYSITVENGQAVRTKLWRNKTAEERDVETEHLFSLAEQEKEREWQRITDWINSQFDEGFQKCCTDMVLFQQATPEQMTKIIAMKTWQRAAWGPYKAVRDRILSGEITARVNLDELDPAPYSYWDIFP